MMLWQVLVDGGWIMVPLAICSFAAAAVVIERLLWGPTQRRVMPDQFKNEITELLDKKRFEELLGVCRVRNSPLARLITTALQYMHKPRAVLRDHLEAAGRREAIMLQRYLGLLGTIAVITPLLGLLGTVFGMIETFGVIQSQGVGDAGALAGGISEALFTTAAGLTIAIPSLVFYRYFLHQTKRWIIEMESFALEVVEELSALNEVPSDIKASRVENVEIIR